MQHSSPSQSGVAAAARATGPIASSAALRPGVYATLLVVALLLALLVKQRLDGVFACPAPALPGDKAYVAYCNAVGYGDYDRGAFWFSLEPRIREAAAEADVLFLGSSRMQFAFSTRATTDWFAGIRKTFYLLGFSHTENVVFAGPLLKQLTPRARAYVINVDRFFDDRVTPPTGTVLHSKDARDDYRDKQRWHGPHHALCSTIPLICGNNLTFVRARDNGTWTLRGSGNLQATGVGDGPPKDREKWPRYMEIARDFVARLPVDRNCILLTIAPSEGTATEEAQAIAASLGLPLVAPRPDALKTFDSSHLDAPSAERWSSAFFAAAGEQLGRCLAGPRAAGTDSETPDV